MKKKTKNPQKKQAQKSFQLEIPPRKYPFVNPIIVTKNKEIIDGQHRYSVCILNNFDIEFIQLDYSKEELYNQECIDEIVKIKKEQSKKLDAFFKENNIDYKTQMLYASSDDKIKYLYAYKDKIEDDGEFWSSLNENYTMSSNNYNYKKELRELFTSTRPNKESLMNEAEREKIKNFPNEIKIYRGMSIIEEESKDYGISWSLNKNIAEKFAETYLHNYTTRNIPHIVKEIVIQKSEIVAYFEERNEEEIIYLGK
jgi:hypothetical protein